MLQGSNMSPSLARGFQDNMNYWLIIANNASLVDTIQDFLCKLGMKPRMQLYSIGNHHFFTKTGHRPTYQNY